MANMNNEIFFVLRKNQFLAVFREFFADVSKNFKTRYLKNRSSDEAHLLTQNSRKRAKKLFLRKTEKISLFISAITKTMVKLRSLYLLRFKK